MSSYAQSIFIYGLNSLTYLLLKTRNRFEINYIIHQASKLYSSQSTISSFSSMVS